MMMSRWRARRVLEVLLVLGLVALAMQGLSVPRQPAPAPILGEPAVSAPGPPGKGRNHRKDMPRRQDLTGGLDAARLRLHVQALDDDGQPVEGARVEVWHADPWGSYGTCQGWWTTDAQGQAAFVTLMPGSTREGGAHVHLSVGGEGLRKVVDTLHLPATPGEFQGSTMKARLGEGLLEARATLSRQ